MKNNSKYLYKIETEFDLKEYRKMYDNFPSFFWIEIFIQSIFGLIISLIIGLLSKNILIFLGFFVVYEFLLIIYNIVKMDEYTEKQYNNLINKKMLDKKASFFFYDSYFVKKGEHITLKVDYKDIKKCIETDSNFYFINISNKTICILKADCSLKLINFIKENLKTEYKREKKQDITYNTDRIKYTILRISLIVNVFTIIGVLLSYIMITGFSNVFKISGFKNLWMCFLWIFIPITTLIFGMLFKNIKYESEKVRKSSIIVVIILLFFGCASMTIIGTADYEIINNYDDVMNVDLPKNGHISFISPLYEQGLDMDGNLSKLRYIEINYEYEDTTKLEKSIKNNKNWILCSKLDNPTRSLFGHYITCSNPKSYITIYNKTTDEYNKVSDLNEDYVLYVMEYNFSSSIFRIESFIYKYN